MNLGYVFPTNQTITVNDVKVLAKMLIENEWTINIYGKTHTVKISDKNFSFDFHNKVRSLGTCSYRKRKVMLSKFYIENNLDKSHLIEEVLRHEIAHAIDYILGYYSSHGEEWKIIAKQIGARPQATSQGDDWKMGQLKYTGTCPNCGKQVQKTRLSKYSQACGKCCNKYNGGRYTDEFRLMYTKNY